MGRRKSHKLNTIHVNTCGTCKKTIKCNNEKFADKLLMLHIKLNHPEDKSGIITLETMKTFQSAGEINYIKRKATENNIMRITESV